MATQAQVEQAAGETGFRPDVVERVIRLLGILTRLDEHEETTGQWLLKGGTALNLFHLPVPRLSLDIDINFTGVEEVRRLPAVRALFERALTTCCAREGCAVRRTPGEHAGGKFRLRFLSVFGGEQSLEVDVSYVARVPLFEPVRRKTSAGAFGNPLELWTLALDELAGGKFAALVARRAARDCFDAVTLLDQDADLLSRPTFRIAFVCQVAGGRRSLPGVNPFLHPLDPLDVRDRLLPLLRVESKTGVRDPVALSEGLRTRLEPEVSRLLSWTGRERDFLSRLEEDGEIEPQLLSGDPVLCDRIQRQPMLLWRRQNVRRFRGLD